MDFPNSTNEMFRSLVVGDGSCHTDRAKVPAAVSGKSRFQGRVRKQTEELKWTRG